MNISENWEDIKFFLALAKEKKLQRAAKLLDSNHTTVYRRIKNFEERFNIKLFESTPDGYFLTSAGDDLYLKVASIEDQMDEVFRSIQGLEDTLKGRVTITTTHSIAATFLPNILFKFQKKWPSLQIDLKVSNQFYNLSKREADIAIRPSNDVPLHLIGRNVGKINFGLYASKKYIKKNGDKNKIRKNLASQQYVGLDNSLSHLKSSLWLKEICNSEEQVLRVDNVNVMGRLCSEGLGLSVLPDYFTGIYKDLVLVSRPSDFIGSDLWILTHKSISKSPKIKTCTDFLFQEIRKCIS
ncbi:LysR family transcriptional regulator [Halobacteriovorax sp. GB3]|uniref:LysR family transcriptional regulator n=1 Tax=Halobacteriovorax sp. GB3 TaxID=2719615 RepID=UPI002362CE12|nr:LysR family transcriptional regulator [Halobacteriovorax sp. GB3]MDD0854342.1 LysR family transcriptional regulator [Halobacteriovorax sp. GB3]